MIIKNNNLICSHNYNDFYKFEEGGIFFAVKAEDFAENTYSLNLCILDNTDFNNEKIQELENFLLKQYSVLLLFLDINKDIYKKFQKVFLDNNWKLLEEKAIKFLQKENILEENHYRLRKIIK